MTIITVTAQQVRAAVNMRDAIDAVSAALVDVSRDRFEQPIRSAMKDGGFLVMPIHHRPSSTAVVKTLSIAFDRTPAIDGTVSWVDPKSSDSIVADAAAITAIRTGAIAGLATELLAPSNAHRMAMIGAGGQSADQIRAVQTVRPLTRLRIYDRNPIKIDRLVERMRREWPDTDIAASSSLEHAISDVDIISTATTSSEPVLEAGMLPEFVHINAIGAFRPTMREIPDVVLARSTVYVEDLAAALEESGEILHAVEHGFLSHDELIPLHRVVTDGLANRTPWTVFKTVGIAAQDWAVARLLSERIPTPSLAST